MYALANTRFKGIAAALMLAACGSNGADDGGKKSKKPATESSAPDGGTMQATASSIEPPLEESLDPVLDGLVGLFGENVESGVVHTIEGGKYEVITEWVSDEPVFHLTMPTDPSAVGGPLPVVVWNNGGCLRSDFLWQKTMFDVWAADGFAILALTSLNGSDDNFGMLGMTSSVEHRALLDWVEKQNESGKYEGVFDLDRVVVAGNSCGGITALESASLDERFAAVFVLSGLSGIGGMSGSTNEVVPNIHIPIGFAIGGEEDFAGIGALADFDALPEGIPAMIAHRFEGDHLTVSSDMTITPDVGKIGLSFMRLVLDGSQDALDELNSDTVCEGCAEGHWRLQSKHLDTLVK